MGERDLPAREVTAAGLVDLGAEGMAVVCVASTLNFALRTPAEQEALVAAFARYLHSLTAPVQLLIRAGQLDLSTQISDLRERASGLPHPALEAAALAHADYLSGLAGQGDLLRRQVLLVLREPLPALPVARLGRRRGAAAISETVRQAAETQLARRVSEAVSLLAASGITVTPLDATQATGVLAGACNPDTLIRPGADLAPVDAVITTAPGLLLTEEPEDLASEEEEPW